MPELGPWIFAACVGVAILHVVFSGMFIRQFYRPAPAIPSRWPKAVIRLSLRGADPELPACLRGFIAQDYPDFELHIIVDHEQDPAWAVVQDVIRETGATHVRVSPLRMKLETCSLKCSATVQAVQDLDPSVEVIAFSDGDVLPQRTWLRELVAGAADPAVGAAYGNRWYMPPKGALGSLTRYAWNAGSVVSIYIMDIPWGGSFAMRTSVIRQTNLLNLWTKAAVEDTPVTAEIKKLGLKARFVPTLMMVNNEECGVLGFFHFIARQMTWTKLYHPSWWSVILHGLLVNAALLGPLVLGILCLIWQETPLALWSFAAFAAYVLLQIVMMLWLEATTRKVVAARGEPTRWLTPRIILALPLAVMLAHTVYLLAVFVVQFRRHVVWRGITYRLAGPWDVHMIRYEPFQQSAKEKGASI